MRPLFLAVLAAACQGDPEHRPRDPGDGPGPDPVLDPGTRPLSRLNAAEYDATVRDLLGTSQRPGSTFPADESAYGFDNIASVLTTTSTHVEGWEVAADELLDEMFGNKDESTGLYGTQAEAAGVTYIGAGMPFGDNAYAVFDGGLSAPIALEFDGEFEVSISAFGRELGGADPVMEVRIDGDLVRTFTVDNDSSSYETYVFNTNIDDGIHTIEVSIANPHQEGSLWRSLVVDYIRLDGPLDPQVGRSEAYDRFVPCAPDGIPTRSCAESSVVAFGRLAWRRPLTDDDVAWAMSLYDAAIDAEMTSLQALQYAFKGLLVAPEFIYRFEQDPDGAPHRELDGYEFATRLASFVWSSMPDEELLDAAEFGTLATPEGVAAELDRLLADDKADALVDNLAGQWFSIRKLETASVDTTIYPEFDDGLRDAMQQELRFLMAAFFRDGAPLGAVLDSQETWVNRRLADHYGVPFDGATDDEWVQTSLVGTGRVGLFGNAGWLMAGSRVDGPSAVKRGKWVLENLLCSPPPPPPPDVEGQVTIEPTGGSVREQEEAQRSPQYCQSCHGAMDPLGFVLWGYDAVGAKRTVDELGFSIDSETTMSGTTLSTPQDLAAWVEADPRLQKCVVQKTLTYALGRPMRVQDDPIVDRITEEFIAGGETFDALARAIVASDAFRLRGAPEVQ